MKKYLSFSFLIMLSCIFYSGHTQGISKNTPAEKTFPEVTIPRTEVRMLHSVVMNRDFEICIKLPYSYYAGNSVYPVAYFTDGNRSFPLVENTSFILEFPKGKVKETIVIGIGYPF